LNSHSVGFEIGIVTIPKARLVKEYKALYNQAAKAGVAMAEYEMIREIFNQCSGNQMRDVFIEEIETDDPDAVIQKYLTGQEVVCNKTVNDKGQIVFDVTTDGLQQRFSFTRSDGTSTPAGS
jgi:hypothetical protein